MKNKFLSICLIIVSISVFNYGCKKDDDGTNDDGTNNSGVSSFVGSYDYNVTTKDPSYNTQTQNCDTITITATHIITISTKDSLADDQLIIRNLEKNNTSEIIITVTDDVFIMSDPNFNYAGSGAKDGNSIEIEYVTYSNCGDKSGIGLAVKR